MVSSTEDKQFEHQCRRPSLGQTLGLESDGTEEVIISLKRWPVAAMKRSIANTIRMCFSAEGEQPRFSRVFSKHSLVLTAIRKNDKVCDDVFLKTECQPTDEAEGIRHAPSSTVN